MTHALSGTALPVLVTPIPGPRSQELADRLALIESPNITSLVPEPPVFWAEARGANVRDVDGNVLLDLTAGFGVANAGHTNAAVAEAIQQQAASLLHALGDVHPAEIKVRLLERIAQIMPKPLQVSILANSGAEAVEAALKTAVVHTGRTGVIAFRDGYHGLTYGALAATHRRHFRSPFEAQLFAGVRFAGFPHEHQGSVDALTEIDALIQEAETTAHPIGAIIVEPIQGRGGIVVPPPDFLAALRARCDGRTRILIFDEVYTGCGRTGRWLACEHWAVVPDVVVIGKALSGSLPIGACVGSAAVMQSWPRSSGEAIHTSTFLGNPLACAAALAQIEQTESLNLLGRAIDIGEIIRARARSWRVEARGRGLIQGIVLDNGKDAHEVCRDCLRAGVLMLAEGPRANVLAVTPPAVITDRQLDFALGIIERSLNRMA